MRPAIAGCRAKLGRAEHHLKTLELEIDRFKRENPIRVTAELVAGLPGYIFHAWEVVPPDPAWGLLVGDCAHNARSALDHLAYQLAVLNLGRDLHDTADEARRINFPIAPDSKSYQHASSRLRGLLRPEDLERIEQLQLHNALNQEIWVKPSLMPTGAAPVAGYLWDLASLDNLDKHRIVQPVWHAPEFLSRLPADAWALGIVGSFTNIDPLKEGGELGRWEYRSEPSPIPDSVDLRQFFPLHVSLRPPYYVNGALRILDNCIVAVRMVLDMFAPRFEEGSAPEPPRYWDGDEAAL